MSTAFALDLRAARRKAGYTQDDIAHLINYGQSHVSDLEQGRKRPNLNEIVTLSLIYGRSFESLFEEVMTECQDHLVARLASLPPGPGQSVATFNRPNSLRKLKRRLHTRTKDHGCA